jgi:hypothetical protein
MAFTICPQQLQSTADYGGGETQNYFCHQLSVVILTRCANGSFSQFACNRSSGQTYSSIARSKTSSQTQLCKLDTRRNFDYFPADLYLRVRFVSSNNHFLLSPPPPFSVQGLSEAKRLQWMTLRNSFRSAADRLICVKRCPKNIFCCLQSKVD